MTVGGMGFIPERLLMMMMKVWVWVCVCVCIVGRKTEDRAYELDGS